MSAHTWETFVANLLALGVDAAQALIRIAVIFAVGFTIVKVLRGGLSRLERFLIRATEKTERAPGAAGQRIKTLANVVWTIASGLLWFIVVLIVLSQFGINIGPILAGAGVVGLAAGFGAQHLVRDLVSGFFLLLENQIRVGDIAIINGTAGLVESVTFRTISLRDQAGVVHVFPNGGINTLANATMDWSAYVIDVSVSFREDSDRVSDIMRRVAEELKQEPAFGRLILEPLEILGVDNFTDTAVMIKARFKTLPSHQYTVGREYRRRLTKAFNAERVEMVLTARPTVARNPEAAATT
ncbi:MAG TPA: mechanosensitive ion channel family protein [Candidatus Binatus sp.]|nr:mechanosensitive ion channel family protein [Candidatus Binatus sp.]